VIFKPSNLASSRREFLLNVLRAGSLFCRANGNLSGHRRYSRAIILKAIIFGYCVLICTLFSSCRRVEPIPKDKQSFVGKWNSEVGISIEIFSKGTANIIRLAAKNGAEKLDIGASDPTNFKVYFLDDNKLELEQPFNIARVYKIDQYPTVIDNHVVMILNGVRLVKE